MSQYTSAVDGERQGFTERLGAALRNAGYEKITYCSLAREFNARSELQPLSVHAVRKWLLAEAIPAQTNLVILAAWLAVSPDWLRFGGNTRYSQTHPSNAVDGSLLSDISRLDLHDRKIVRHFIDLLVQRVAT